MSQTDIRAAPPRMMIPAVSIVIEGAVATGFWRCHHDRHKHGRLVRRQRQLAAPRRLAPGKEMLRADLVPTCHLRHDRGKRKRFRDIICPLSFCATPPSPATNATADLDAPARRGSVNYMVDHISEPMPSTGSHLPNYAALGEMGERHRFPLLPIPRQ